MPLTGRPASERGRQGEQTMHTSENDRGWGLSQLCSDSEHTGSTSVNPVGQTTGKPCQETAMSIRPFIPSTLQRPLLRVVLLARREAYC